MTGETSAGARRRPDLDGLRGTAVLLVVLDHAGFEVFRGVGGMGVTLFFCLSGYLITGLLLAEHARTGAIDLRGFYMRRARRLLPALLVFLAVVLGLWGLEAVPTVVVTLLYIANAPASSDHAWLFAPLHHMWSLAVEEQFYLVWPVLLLVLLRLVSGRRFATLLLAIALLALSVRMVGYPVRGYDWTYRATLPNAFPLVAGAAVAARIGLARLQRWSLPGALGVAMLVGLVIAPVEPSDDWMILRTLLTVVAALLLLVRSPGWMTLAPLRYCGRVSYGWYLWHVPLQFLLGGITGSVVSLGVAAVSWHLWERPWLRPRPVAAPDRQAVAGDHDASLDRSTPTRP